MSEDYMISFYLTTLKEFRPPEMIEAWNELCDIIDKGYNDFEDELHYDLSLRDEINDLINDEELNKFPDHKIFVEKIFEIDEKIKNLIFHRPNVKRTAETPWWNFVILKRGGPRYVADIKAIFNIDIELT